MRAGLYARVSREEQAEGYSIDAQLRAMRQFCESKSWEVAAEYVEPGASGTTVSRPAFQEAMADCQAGKLDVLMTHQLDRFHRNLRQQLDTFSKLADWGVAYVSVTEQIDYSTPQGMLFLQMLGAFNEYYVANLRREVKKGKRGRAKAGLPNSNRPPYGYVRVDGRDIVDPEAAKIIRYIYEQYATGDYSYHRLATKLNREGWPAGPYSNGQWAWQSMRYVLANSYYIGQVTYYDQTYPGQHEPIISRELWNEVSAIRQRRIGRRSRPTKDATVYLLQGIAYCTRCHHLLYAERHEGIRYYRDSARFKGQECPGRYARADWLERQVVIRIKRLHLPEDWRVRIVELANNDEERQQAETQRRKLQEAMRRLRQQHRWGVLEDREFLSEHATMQAEFDSLVVPETPAIEEAGLYLEKIGDLWDMITPVERREAVQTMLVAVHVDMVERSVTDMEFHPDFARLLG